MKCDTEQSRERKKRCGTGEHNSERVVKETINHEYLVDEMPKPMANTKCKEGRRGRHTDSHGKRAAEAKLREDEAMN